MFEKEMATGTESDGQKSCNKHKIYTLRPVNSQELCSGYGQWHSHYNKRNPQNYVSVTLPGIEKMAEDPPSVAKANAQWVIFSLLHSRVHAEQREKGVFPALWADIDNTNGLTFIEIVSLSLCVIPNSIAYTTRSATLDKQKTRFIVPLAEPINGELFVIAQKILNDKLANQGIVPDRATERAGQVCYLPNRGDFYQYYIDHYLGPLNVESWTDEIRAERQRIKAEAVAFQERRQLSRLKAAKCMEAGCLSPIDAFNQAYDLELILESFGYIRCGNRFLSPLSESGVPGVVTRGDKWFSFHVSDSGIGIRTQAGTFGDAFDLFTYFNHKGDRNAAIRAAGEMFTVNGVSMTRANRQKYMESVVNG